MDASGYLAAYDRQLRGDVEVASADAVERLGPLLVARFGSGRGFVTYADAASVTDLVGAAVDQLLDLGVNEAEWKTRGHDATPGLHEALLAHGFEPEEPESVMVGEARLLAVDVELPPDLTLRGVTEESDVRAASAVTDRVFGDPVSASYADHLLRRLARGDGTELWVAEANGEIVGSGRVEPVASTDFAGLWGGVVVEGWRGRGIYRALTAARARSAIAAGRTLLHSDSTEFSRPIQERSGLVRVSTTTPYRWRRPA